MKGFLWLRALVATFLRSLLIQGSWNYQTMIGTGFGFSMLPGLRRLFRDRPEEMEAAVERHLEHFNAHPYLASVALGASLRLEAEGDTPETVRRFKTAVRGPLGSLGDALVWATWLPLVSMSSVALYWLGLPGPWAALCFVVMYNTGHVGLRLWGFHIGLDAGRNVAVRLAGMRLTEWTARLRSWGVVVLGVLGGALLGGSGGLGDAGVLWTALAALGFVVGLLVGHQVWRPAATVVVVVIGVLAIWGTVG
ncbi:MAG: PTS system mannose/fructose/sorbose family transporter subunit IID [Gemmatimonadota bacterium]|nr:PTS system mannose/fructose/sorbose family transporter subunit IID [Gemmatimonadota bacterium]